MPQHHWDTLFELEMYDMGQKYHLNCLEPYLE